MSLSVTLLPTSHGSDSQLQPLTSFLVDDRLAIDAGNLGFALAPDAQASVTDVLVTHPHIDHTGGLPIHVAAAFTRLDRPVSVHGTADALDALRAHLFNETMWPDFTRIALPESELPAMEFHEIRRGEPFRLGNLKVTAVEVNHVVPTIGVAVESEDAGVVFTSDTYVCDEIWELANRVENLKAVFVDCSYPNELAWLAETSKHLTPRLIAGEMEKLRRPAHVFAVHIKPSTRERVLADIAEVNRPNFTAAEIGRRYEW